MLPCPSSVPERRGHYRDARRIWPELGRKRSSSAEIGPNLSERVTKFGRIRPLLACDRHESGRRLPSLAKVAMLFFSGTSLQTDMRPATPSTAQRTTDCADALAAWPNAARKQPTSGLFQIHAQIGPESVKQGPASIKAGPNLAQCGPYCGTRCNRGSKLIPPHHDAASIFLRVPKAVNEARVCTRNIKRTRCVGEGSRIK